MAASSNEKSGMTLIVKTITRITVGLILIYGIYIVLHGHISPGGGFAGGLIAALAFIQILLAFGRDRIAKKLNRSKCLLLMSVGALTFLTGVTLGAGLIPLCDIAISVMVGTGLFMVFLALVMLISPSEEKG